jgi:prefoldin subunit 5
MNRQNNIQGISSIAQSLNVHLSTLNSRIKGLDRYIDWLNSSTGAGYTPEGQKAIEMINSLFEDGKRKKEVEEELSLNFGYVAERNQYIKEVTISLENAVNELQDAIRTLNKLVK